jgi:hypothetical protein
LLPNDLIIVKTHGDDKEDGHDIKGALERQGDAHIKVEIKSTQSPGLRWLQIDVQDAYRIRSGRSTYARKEHRINFPMALVPGPNKI